MDTTLIKKLLKSFKCFKGVFPSDLLPLELKTPLTIIVNTDPSSEPGEHWVSISISSDGHGYYFDSFGLPPLRKDIFNYMVVKCKKGWTYNRLQLQHINSITCGHYCVLYVIFRCQDLSNELFLSTFSRNTLNNDKKILRIFKNFSLAKEILPC